MPRPRGSAQEVISIRIPADLKQAVDEKLKDPLRNRNKHGSVKQLITSLLYSWLDDKNPSYNRLDDL